MIAVRPRNTRVSSHLAMKSQHQILVSSYSYLNLHTNRDTSLQKGCRRLYVCVCVCVYVYVHVCLTENKLIPLPPDGASSSSSFICIEQMHRDDFIPSFIFLPTLLHIQQHQHPDLHEQTSQNHLTVDVEAAVHWTIQADRVYLL